MKAFHKRSGKQHGNTDSEELDSENQVSSPKDNKVLFDFFAFLTEAEPWEFFSLALSSELAFMIPSFNSSSWPMALRLVFDLTLDLDEEEKESPWEPDLELDVGSFKVDWEALEFTLSAIASSAFGSGSGGRPFSITKTYIS